MVLGKYLTDSVRIATANLRVLEIKNCGLSGQSMSSILNGVVSQPRISSINIFNEIVNSSSMEHLVAILSREPPNSLAELQLVGCTIHAHVI